jgi:hypothetical protein
MVQLPELLNPAHSLSVERLSGYGHSFDAYSASILGCGDRIPTYLEGGQTDKVLRLLIHV